MGLREIFMNFQGLHNSVVALVDVFECTYFFSALVVVLVLLQCTVLDIVLEGKVPCSCTRSKVLNYMYNMYEPSLKYMYNTPAQHFLR